MGAHKKSGRAGKLTSRSILEGFHADPAISLLMPGRPARSWLFAQAKTLDNLTISIRIAPVKVIQQTPALVDHHDQSAPRRMIL